MEVTTIMLMLVIVLGIIGMTVGIYFWVKDQTLENMRKSVYHLFLVAENTFKESKSGKQKMQFVVSKARSLLPNYIQVFVTEEMLYRLIQFWFDSIKDLLDDGKYNQSSKTNE